MPDGATQYTVRKGGRATSRALTEEQAQKLSAAGFEVSEAQPVVAPESEPEPEPIASEPQPRAASVSAPAAFGRGSAQGATMGFGDEGSAGFAGALGMGEDAAKWIAERTGMRKHDDTDDVPRTYAAGSQYADMRNNIRGENKRAADQQGAAYLGGEVFGSLAPAALTSRVPLPAPATLAGRMGLGAAEGTALGGVAGAGHSESETAGGVAADAAKTAAIGGVLGGAMPAAAAGLGAMAHGVASGAKGVADRARVAATGAYGGQVKSLVKDKGPDAIGRYADVIEREGIHQGSTPLPQSWGTYAENAAQVADDAGKKIGALSEDAASKVQVDVKPMVDELLEEAVKLEGVRTPEARTMMGDLLERAEMLDKGPMRYDEALDMRRMLDKIAWNEERANNGAAAERARGMAGRIRKAMMDSLDEEHPALRKAIQEQNERYEVASWANTMAERRVAQETGNQAVSLPAWIAGSGGLAAVGADGGSSVIGGLAAGTAAQLAKTRGKSAIAGTARGVEHAAADVGDALAAVSANAPESVAVTTPAASRRIAADMPSGATGVAAAQPPPKQTAAERNETLLERVRATSASNPDALGEYGAQLAASRTPDEFAVRHASLMRTDQDYRRRIRRLSEQEQEADERGGEPQPQETEE